MKRIPALLFSGVFVAVAGVAILQPAPEGPLISGPYPHENLTIFLLHDSAAPEGGDLLTRDEAVAAGSLRVMEQGEGARVDALDVENSGNRPVFLQAGETLQGGKQDRVIGQDTVLPARSGRRSIPVFCVEPNRWKHASSVEADFRSNDVDFATKEQRLAVRLDKDQQTVWKCNLSGNMLISKECGNLVQDSFVATTADPAVTVRAGAYIDALRNVPDGRRDVVGMAFAVNGRMDSVELYGSKSLFRKLWPKLIRTAALAALARKSQPVAGTARAHDVRTLLAQAAAGSVRDRDAVGHVSCTTRQNGKAVQFETRLDGRNVRVGTSLMD